MERNDSVSSQETNLEKSMRDFRETNSLKDFAKVCESLGDWQMVKFKIISPSGETLECGSQQHTELLKLRAKVKLKHSKSRRDPQ